MLPLLLIIFCWSNWRTVVARRIFLCPGHRKRFSSGRCPFLRYLKYALWYRRNKNDVDYVCFLRVCQKRSELTVFGTAKLSDTLPGDTEGKRKMARIHQKCCPPHNEE